MIEKLPNFNNLADQIEGILGITDAIPEISVFIIILFILYRGYWMNLII